MYKGTLVSGDFQDNTMTFEMSEDFELQAGEYRILKEDKFKEMEFGNELSKVNWIVLNLKDKEKYPRLSEEFKNNKRSMQVLVEDETGQKHIASLLSFVLDEKPCFQWLCSNGNIIKNNIIKWAYISHLLRS